MRISAAVIHLALSELAEYSRGTSLSFDGAGFRTVVRYHLQSPQAQRTVDDLHREVAAVIHVPWRLLHKNTSNQLSFFAQYNKFSVNEIHLVKIDLAKD